MSAKSAAVLGFGLGTLSALVVGVPLLNAATAYFYEHYWLPLIAGEED